MSDSFLASGLLQVGNFIGECVECRAELVYAPEFPRIMRAMRVQLILPEEVTRLVVVAIMLTPGQLLGITQRLDHDFGRWQEITDVGNGGRVYLDELSENTRALYCLQSVAVVGLGEAEIRVRRRSRNRSRGRQSSQATRLDGLGQRLAQSLQANDFEEAARLRDEIIVLQAKISANTPPAQ